MRKGCDGKNGGKIEWKIRMFIVATSLVAIQPIGTLTPRASYFNRGDSLLHLHYFNQITLIGLFPPGIESLDLIHSNCINYLDHSNYFD